MDQFAINPGVTILSGPQDWQIFQRNEDGFAEISLAGTWKTDEPVYFVQARVVDENTNQPVTLLLDWRDADMDREAQRFKIVLSVPQGGLYRIETRVKRPFAKDSRALRGDYVHHIGVGDLYIIAGQSNASGTGKGAANDGPMLGVHLFANDEKWKLATHPLEDATHTLHPITITRVFHGHSPWLAFGKKILSKQRIPIGLIPTALGGSAISRWVKDEEHKGDLFDNMADMVQKAGGRAAGILWYQGESDLSEQALERYADRFTRFVQQTRQLLKKETLPVFTAQINAAHTEQPNDAAWSRMREIQRQLCQTLNQVYLIITIDCAMSDEVHNNAGSNVWIGERFADSALEHVYGEPILSSYPEVSRIQFLGNDRLAIQMDFTHVAGDWTPKGKPDNFSVQDEAGWIPIASLTYGESHTIVLNLQREPVGATTVHGLYGAAPKPFLFDDNGRCITPFSWTI
ncbi:MAG: hypothetical protein JWN30_2661 [Bacilli bacterium]|nr:hypothetical protein [Bacilli bacterium]